MDQPPNAQGTAGRRRVILLVVAALLVAAVGGVVVGVLLARNQAPQTAPSPSPTPTPASPSPQPVPTQTVQSPQPLATETFIMPSRNIGCGFFEALRCDILSGLNPTPSGACELDWTGLTLEPQGNAAPQCAGDTVFDPQAPALEYGQTWSLAGINCQSRQLGLRCTNALGHGFELARADWEVF
ncbi:MAG TPA: DUF6636 domain-containing protein [Actinomycetota bacterium]|nr:DUF6636 domain-containing protein [Actinomycetota bacterium]